MIAVLPVPATPVIFVAGSAMYAMYFRLTAAYQVEGLGFRV